VKPIGGGLSNSTASKFRGNRLKKPETAGGTLFNSNGRTAQYPKHCQNNIGGWINKSQTNNADKET